MSHVKVFPDPRTGDADGVIVRRPRATDAIGSALRNAFISETCLPMEWVRSLNAIDATRR